MTESDITRSLRATAGRVGFDLVAELPRSAYDRTVSTEHRLPGVGPADALTVVIGNTRSIWPVFQEVLASTPSLLEEPHPLDRWTVTTLAAIFEAAAKGVAYEVRYVFEPPPRRILFQKLAQSAGLAHLGPAQLSLHPTYGPWIAFRAVAVFDARCATEPSRPADPCSSCPGQPCMGSLQRAVARGGAATWEDWLAVRDACPEGKDRRYPDEQVRFHYAANAELARALEQDTRSA